MSESQRGPAGSSRSRSAHCRPAQCGLWAAATRGTHRRAPVPRNPPSAASIWHVYVL